MLNFNFTWDLGVSLEQMVGFEMAAAVWAHYFSDDITINLHVASANTLGEDGEAVGGAVPLFHELNYGVFKEYYYHDIISGDDTQAYGSLEHGNNVNLMINDELVDGNTQMLVTSAQAKALGMDQALLLDNGTTWDRDLVDPNALDGYIIINQSFDWNYDFARENEAPEESLDFFSMALHEIGHQLGFVSGIDGTLDVLQLHSGETRIEDFTVLDLFRKTIDSGTVSDVTLGESAYFSIDGGTTNLANFSTGDQEEDFQASHWERFQTAIGVMDPTLAYKERLELTTLDLQAFDVLGYNLDSSKIGTSLDLTSLMEQAEAAVSNQLGINLADLSEGNGTTDLYHIGYSGWWKLFEKQIHEIGYSGWWDVLEEGYEYWQQELNGETLEIGYSGWWQLFDLKMTQLESELLAIGYSGWWQEFKNDMLAIGYSGWWEVFEIGYSGWWQALDQYYSTLGGSDENTGSVVEQVLNQNEPSPSQTTTTGGNKDDIIAGTQGRDLISGLKGDDLIDGKSGADMLMGDEGDDIVYGWDGNDTIYGGEGDDMLAGERDDDQLYGEAGADILSGNSGDDILSGGEGKDVLKGDQGKDVLMGGTADDVLDGGEDDDLLLGETGQDVLEGGAGDDILRGDRYSTTANSQTDQSEPTISSLQSELGITPETASASGVNFWMRLEAESMKKLIHYNQKTDITASGETVISTGGKGKARTKFTGPTGVYDLVVSYYDSDSGQGEITLKVDNQEVDSWILNQDANGFVTRIIEDVSLSNGDRIELRGQASGNESVTIDYLDIINVDDDSAYDYGNLNGDNQFSLFTSTTSIQANTFRLEAEAMTLANGYQVETGIDIASENSLISHPGGGKATATYIFDNNSGVYDIFASYLDGIGGKAKAQVKINGKNLSSWMFKEDNGLAEYRLLGAQIPLNQGDVIEVIGQAKGSDLAQIDYLDFVPVLEEQLTEDSYINDYLQTENLVANRVEVENMTIVGNHKVKSMSVASGSQFVESQNKNSTITANTTFDGATGYYNIVLGYFDGDRGIAQFDATLNDIQELDSWQADLSLGDDQAQAQTFVSRTLATNLLLSTGDELQIEGIPDDKDYAFMDYVDFVPYNPTAPIRLEAEYMNATGDYELEEYEFASSGRVLRSNSTNSADALKLNSIFKGESGLYTIVVHYFDENDGQAQISATLRGNTIDTWITDQNLGNNLPALENSLTRTVASNIQFNNGDVFELTSIRNDNDYGRIDYVEFIPYNPDAMQQVDNNFIQLEIEDMQLTGEDVDIQESNFAFAGAYVQADDDAGSSFTASTLFTDEEGYYDIEIGYYDTNQGEASITVKLNEDELSSWVNNQDFGTSSAGVDSFTTRTVAEAVYLEPEDVIQIIGQEHNGDRVNADYIRLIPVEAPTVSPANPAISVNENGDILRGGAGNDQLFGDEGDDLLYGEDEYDTPNSSIASNDTLEGGSGNDTLYGNSGDDFLYGDDKADINNAIVKTPETLSFQQGVDDYSFTVDTFVTSSSPNTNRSSSTSLNVDGDSGGSPVQVLIRFEDIFGSNLGKIASDDMINSAVLEIEVFNQGSAIEVYEMMQNWSDSDTWNSLGSGIQADGIEAALNPVFTTSSVGTGKLTIDVTSSLQAWQANPNGNYGWAFLPTGNDGVDFYSAEGSIAPRLVVDVNQSTAAEISPSIQFDGNDALTFNHTSEMLLNEGTLSFSFQADSVSQRQGLFSKDSMNYDDGGHITVLLENGNLKVRLQSTSNSYEVQTAVVAGQNYDVSIAFGSRGLELWLDGTLMDTSSYTGGLGTSSGGSGNSEPIVLGANQWASGDLTADVIENYFTGTLRDVRLYDQQLTNTEISQLSITASATANVVFEELISEENTFSNSVSGNDFLTGNSGNDDLIGGGGNDTLNGTDKFSRGIGEQDILTGGAGADTFILGDENNAYYLESFSPSLVESFATVIEFDPNVDSLQLNGGISYLLTQQGNNEFWLSYQDDLVAKFQNSPSFELNSPSVELNSDSSFSFVTFV